MTKLKWIIESLNFFFLRFRVVPQKSLPGTPLWTGNQDSIDNNLNSGDYYVTTPSTIIADTQFLTYSTRILEMTKNIIKFTLTWGYVCVCGGSSETNLWLHNLKIKLIWLLNHKALGQNVDYSRAGILKDLLWVQTLEWITNSLPSTTGGCEDVNGGSSACLTTPTALQIKSADNGVVLTSENRTVFNVFVVFQAVARPPLSEMHPLRISLRPFSTSTPRNWSQL